MNVATLLFVLLAASALYYYMARRRSLSIAGRLGGIRQLRSAPSYYGIVSAFAFGLPALLLLGMWLYLEQFVIVKIVLAEFFPASASMSQTELDLLVSRIKVASQALSPGAGDAELHEAAAARYGALVLASQNMRAIAAVALGACIGTGFLFYLSEKFRAREIAERVIRWLLFASSLIAIFTTLGIIFSVLFEAIKFFQRIPVLDFLFGLHWSPQIAIRQDQVGASGAFGSVPLFTGTLLVAGVAMAIAVPIGLMSAIYLSEYASKRTRAVAKPALEILAGIPTVVYGFFAVLVVAPLLHEFGASIGLDIAHESALAAGSVMGIMIIPFVSSLSDDVMTAVPRSIREASLAIGATRSETVKKVIFPAALPGIVGALLLAISRAIGETMIVLMAAGLAARLTANPLESVTTVTVQIVTLLVGDQEFDNPKTLAAFALGLTLFLVTLVLNFTALHVVRKYSEQYE